MSMSQTPNRLSLRRRSSTNISFNLVPLTSADIPKQRSPPLLASSPSLSTSLPTSPPRPTAGDTSFSSRRGSLQFQVVAPEATHVRKASVATAAPPSPRDSESGQGGATLGSDTNNGAANRSPSFVDDTRNTTNPSAPLTYNPPPCSSLVGASRDVSPPATLNKYTGNRALHRSHYNSHHQQTTSNGFQHMHPPSYPSESNNYGEDEEGGFYGLALAQKSSSGSSGNVVAVGNFSAGGYGNSKHSNVVAGHHAPESDGQLSSGRSAIIPVVVQVPRTAVPPATSAIDTGGMGPSTLALQQTNDAAGNGGSTSSGEVSAKNSFQKSYSSSRSQAQLSKANSDSGVLFQTFSSAVDAVKGYSSSKLEGGGDKHSPLRPVGSDGRLHAATSALCSAYQSPQNHQLASVSDSVGSFFTLSYVNNGAKLGMSESGGKNANNAAGSGQPTSGPIRTDSGKYKSSNGCDDLSMHELVRAPSLLTSKGALPLTNSGERKKTGGEIDAGRSRHNFSESEGDDEAALLEATRLKMTIPVLRRHLVESLKGNTRVVRKLNAQHLQQQQPTLSSNLINVPTLVSQQPLQQSPLALISLGDSVRRRSLKLSAVSFNGRDEEFVLSSPSAVVPSLSSSQLRRHQSLSTGPRQRRGTVEAALLGLAGAGEDTASRRRSSSQSASSQTATNQQNKVASPTRSSYDDCAHQQLLHQKGVPHKERSEGPIHDPSDATDPALVTKRVPEWMIDDEDPSSLPAMQRYLSIKSRQRRERITNTVSKEERSRNHNNNNNNNNNEGGAVDYAATGPKESPRTNSRASPLSSSREVGGAQGRVVVGGETVGEDSSLFGSAKRSNMFASQKGGGGTTSHDTTLTAHPTCEFFYRVGNETKSGIVPANSKLGLDHNTLAKMVGSPPRPYGNATTSGHDATVPVPVLGASASVMRKGRGQNNNSTSNGAACSLMIEGGGAAFISSVAFHSPYVQGVLAPLLKQTREREKILENTSAAYGTSVDVEKELETSTVRRWSLSALRANGRGKGGEASSPPGSPMAGLSPLATNTSTPQAAELAAVLMSSSQRGGGGAHSRDFGGDRDPTTPAPLSNRQMADIYSTSSRRDLLRRAAVEGPLHRLSREDKLVATVLLEEMDRKKKELLDALDDDLGHDAHPQGSSAKKMTPAASFVLGGSKVDPSEAKALSSQQSPLSHSLRRSVSPTSRQDSVVYPPRGPNNRRCSVSPPAAEGSSPIGVKRELSTLSADSTRRTSAVTKPIPGGKAMRTASFREEGQLVSNSTPRHQPKRTGRVAAIDTDELNQLSRPLLSRFKEKVTAPMLESYNILIETEKHQPWLIESVPKKATSSSDPPSDSASSLPRGHPSLVRSRAQALLQGPETLLSFYDTTATATRHLVEHHAALRAAMANASGPSGSYLLSGKAEARHRAKMLEPTRHGGLNVFVSNPLAGMDLGAPSLLAATQERCEDAVARKRLALVLKILEDEEDVGRRKIILAAAEEARKSAEALDVEFEQENRWRRPYVPRQRF